MGDESGRSTFSEGYAVPILGLLSLLFALMAGLTAGRALSGDPADAVLPIAFGVGAVFALWLRRRYTGSE
jgi:4-amino-4-deoxy-L-arabinose transferase-like glycosyltransferase